MSEPSSGSLIFEALIVPHRSLSARGERWLLGSLIALCAVIALRFWLLGAWPVMGFCVAEGAVVAALFWLHRRRARASELLLLSTDRLRVIRISPDGRRSEVALPAAWLNVVLEEREGRVPRLLLGQWNRRVEVATALGEAEKRDLASALRDALYNARNPRFGVQSC